MIKFGLLYLIIYLFLVLAAFLITKQFTSTDVRFFEMSKVVSLALPIVSHAATAYFGKTGIVVPGSDNCS